MTDPQIPAVPPADGSVPPAAPPPMDASYAAAPPPAYAAAPPPAYAPPATASVPGKTLGIVALVVVFFFSLIGLILGYVARSQSKKAGVTNTPAKVAIILGWIFLVVGIIVSVIAISLTVAAASELARLCAEYGSGVHDVNGVTLTCG